jgi:hypothetical protein
MFLLPPLMDLRGPGNHTIGALAAIQIETEVLPSHKQMVFIVQFTACIGPYRPSSGDLEECTAGDNYIHMFKNFSFKTS